MFYRKAVTKIFLGLFIFCLILGKADFTGVQAAQTPEQATTQFYQWYLHELNRNKDPRSRQKTKLLGYLSKRLGKWIYSIPDEEYGADYFISAQDFDEKWVVNVSKAKVVGNKASLKVLLARPKGEKSPFKRNLAIQLIKENGAWKIDKISDLD